MNQNKEKNTKNTTKRGFDLTSNFQHLTSNKGITLVALVITIIVLLILAVVAIRAIQNDSIINYAKNSVDEYERAEANEQTLLGGYVGKIEEYVLEKDYGQDNIKVEYTMTEGSNLWSTTVTMNISLKNEPELTVDQKRDIAAYLLEFNSFDDFLLAMGISAEEVPEEFLDIIIEAGKKYIDYSDTAKLESVGIKPIIVTTPYNGTLYTSNLGGEVKCSFARNGTYDFNIKSGDTQKTETITIDNLRTVSTQGPYRVNIELSKSILDTDPVDSLLYSIDETDTWQELRDDTIIQCNNSIYFKFEDVQQKVTEDGGVQDNIGYALHYVEKNDEYYKYFNEESPQDWLFVRFVYSMPLMCSILAQEGSMRQNLILYSINDPSAGEMLASNIYSRIPGFYDEFPEGMDYKITGENIDFPEEIASKYPELELGEDDVIVWNHGMTESPIYKLEVLHDMSILMHDEPWD